MQSPNMPKHDRSSRLHCTKREGGLQIHDVIMSSVGAYSVGEARIRHWGDYMPKKYYFCLLLGLCLLTACSYDSEKAVKNGDVINMNGPVFNFDRFEQFLESVEAEDAAAVRIANYTLDGNPTLYNLSFDGSVFDLEIDRSKNKERGDNPRKMNLSCTDLMSEEGQQLFIYTLEGCGQESDVDSFLLLNILKEQIEAHEHE